MPKRGGRGGGRGRQKGALKRELVFKTDGETEYAQVTKMLGNSRVETLCIADGRSRQCKIRGSLRVWIQAGDIVLISLRDFQDTKADVIWKYTADEARKLKRSGALPDGTKLNENDAGGGSFVFVPCLLFELFSLGAVVVYHCHQFVLKLTFCCSRGC
jgi:translation initiation factor 1A